MLDLLIALEDGESVSDDDLMSLFQDEAAVTVRRALDLYGIALVRELERGFSSTVLDLVSRTRGTPNLRLDVVHGSPAWSVSLTVSRRSRRLTRAFQAPGDLRSLVRGAASDVEPHELIEGEGLSAEYAAVDAFSMFRSSLTRRLFAEIPAYNYYLPAARSGVMQSHRALASSVISRAPLAGIESIEVPRMTGVVSDFLAQVLAIDTEVGTALEDVADYLEAYVLKGHISLKEERYGAPEILYEPTRSRAFPLHRTSSMVSELAPLALYLRYQVDPNELLIIEEPESSLHPESQRRLADVIAILVNRRVQVVLTTHSDYFVTALSNSVQAAALVDADRRPATGIPLLDAEAVNAYLFAPSGAGTHIQRLRVSPRHGIPQRDFARVARELYDESVRLDQQFD
jgi:hypothetical protein